ncbi:MAG: efflux RND transporter periplasmic adaptor subunit [Desulfomonilaceae bacterium]|nr:efflux RND transporter periplasmic adaptor subunit [Desulfomonilaceae bacterium]
MAAQHPPTRGTLQSRSVRQTLVRDAVLVSAILAPLLFLSGCGRDPVQVVNPQRGEIRESFTEPAKTRLENQYPITVPVAGRIRRIDLEPNDKVAKGSVLVRYDPVPFREAVREAKARVAELEASLVVQDDDRLEQTALVEAKSAIAAADEALKASREQVAAERARWVRADKELQRMTALLESQAIPQTKMDDVNLAAETALIEWKQQQFYLSAMKAIVLAVNLGPLYVTRYLDRKNLEREVLVEQLNQAKARLTAVEHDLKLTDVRSPIDGVVLEKYEEGDSTLQAGKPLLLIGNLDDLEVTAEVLTQDAMRISPGSEVLLYPSIGTAPLPAKVKRIDPAGFTKLSSLGVEQQRVNVIVTLNERQEGLGVGYRVQARFFVGSKPDALLVSRFSVMQSPDGSFYVLKVQDGRIRKQPIQIGLRNDLQLEVSGGLTDKDVIVAKPDTTMEEGMRVKPVKDEGGT